MVIWRNEFSGHTGPALSDGQQVLSYSELLDAVEQRADWLRKQRVQVLGLALENGLEWVLFDLASTQAGVPCVPLPGFFSASQKRHVLTSTGADLLIADTAKGAEATPFSGTFIRMNEGFGRPKMPPGTAKITFTSGSTGEPKGVCLSAEQQLTTARTIASAVDTHQPAHLSVLPLSTLLENVAGVYAPLLAGGTVYVPATQSLGFDGGRLIAPQFLLRALSNFRPDTTILVPELLQVLLQGIVQGWQPPASLQFIAVGGAKVPEQLLQQASAAGLPVYEGYGLSECGSVVALNTPHEHKAGSIGRLLPHVRARFRQGELMVQGSSFLGYLSDPASWAPGEIATGDLIDIDDQGWLRFRGRCCNQLVTSLGRNVSPEWPESLLLGSGKLLQAVVLGDARPYLVAVLVPRQPLNAEDVHRLLQAINDELPSYARIQQCVLTCPMSADSGLYTANGRPKRGAIADHFAADIAWLYEQPDQPLLTSTRIPDVA